jgi:chromate transporter
VIPFLQRDAVEIGAWMTNAQFLDGLALSGILPAPLIIFSTFVGYVGGGPSGAVAITFGIFLPAFLFTLVGHDYLEQVVNNPSIHTFLDGITAGVVGLITATTILLFREGITSLPSLIIFMLALLIVYIWKAKAAVAAIVLGAGLLGLLLFAG